jgi:hypothetical protein
MTVSTMADSCTPLKDLLHSTLLQPWYYSKIAALTVAHCSDKVDLHNNNAQLYAETRVNSMARAMHSTSYTYTPMSTSDTCNAPLLINAYNIEHLTNLPVIELLHDNTSTRTYADTVNNIISKCNNTRIVQSRRVVLKIPELILQVAGTSENTHGQQQQQQQRAATPAIAAEEAEEPESGDSMLLLDATTINARLVSEQHGYFRLVDKVTAFQLKAVYESYTPLQHRDKYTPGLQLIINTRDIVSADDDQVLTIIPERSNVVFTVADHAQQLFTIETVTKYDHATKDITLQLTATAGSYKQLATAIRASVMADKSITQGTMSFAIHFRRVNAVVKFTAPFIWRSHARFKTGDRAARFANTTDHLNWHLESANRSYTVKEHT